jgi:hypothetical protein
MASSLPGGARLLADLYRGKADGSRAEDSERCAGIRFPGFSILED